VENKVIKVTGMTCGGCVRSVTNVLTALPGVEKADVSREAGTAAVLFDPKLVNLDALKHAIREAGYEAA
jgi:copper chaperone